MVLPAVVETALSRYKRPVLTIKLREHKKTAHRINIKFYMPTMVTRGRIELTVLAVKERCLNHLTNGPCMVEGVGIEPTQNTGLQPVALPTELTLHMGAGVRVELTLDELMRLVSLPFGLSR